MKSSINVTTCNNCEIHIEDTSAYLEETKSEGKHQFKYSDTISIDILRHNKLDKNVYKDIIFSDHSTREPITMPVKVDGWFSIIHIILPSKDWFDTQLEKIEGSRLGLYGFIYYSDGITIYKYNPKTKEKPVAVPLDEILELNLEAGDYTIYSNETDYVSICFLRKCYINLCKQIFNSRGFSSCWSKNTIDSELVYKRDLVWMTINVIKYLTECNQLMEVERIVEVLQGCNSSICPSNLNTSKVNGCGCGK